MICVVIKGPSFEEARQQISKAITYADLVELRLDCFDLLDLAALKDLRKSFSVPMIFTLRSQIQGGNYAESEENRLADIRQLIELNPEYLDLENHIPTDIINDVIDKAPAIKIILSYHNFVETPEALEGIYQKIQKIPACFYKIAVTAKDSLDVLRFICWAKRYDRLISISMGTHGQISRILGPTIGCPITYASLDESQESAPGQLSAKTLIEKFHFRSLNPKTAIYGLIGDPVSQSISDETHNCLFASHGIDAVYVKLKVGPHNLSDFLMLAKRLPFAGLSVTMPLKEHILPYLDEIDPDAKEIGAVNTLLFEEGIIKGFNTDGIGALNAIERHCKVKGKRIVIIGAGGASKAIVHEALRRGAQVTILNRDADKAFQMGQHFHCSGKGLEKMHSCAEEGYDILINCTPSSLPIDCEDILPQTIVMDIKTRPMETELLKAAKLKGCLVIYGYEMFVEQALGQFYIWFKNFNIQTGRSILEKKAIDCL